MHEENRQAINVRLSRERIEQLVAGLSARSNIVIHVALALKQEFGGFLTPANDYTWIVASEHILRLAGLEDLSEYPLSQHEIQEAQSMVDWLENRRRQDAATSNRDISLKSE